ncbi:hypothetical protein SprV_0200790400 [Sparganum proliferum]
MLIHQISELRQQHAAMMDLLQGPRNLSICPSESSGLNFREVATLEQLGVLVSARAYNTYRQQLIRYIPTVFITLLGKTSVNALADHTDAEPDEPDV